MYPDGYVPNSNPMPGSNDDAAKMSAMRSASEACLQTEINKAIASGNICAQPPKREKCQINLRNQAKRDRQRAEELFRRASEADKIADQIDRMPPEIEHLIADYFGMQVSARSVNMFY